VGQQRNGFQQSSNEPCPHLEMGQCRMPKLTCVHSCYGGTTGYDTRCRPKIAARSACEAADAAPQPRRQRLDSAGGYNSVAAKGSG